MALFSKPPAKKPPASQAKAVTPPSRPGRASARELTAKAGAGERPKLEPVPADESITGASLIEWSPQPQAIEVAQANPGLCAVLENAALLYASGQTPGARALLEQGVASDHDTKQSPLAWLALFDVLQRAGDRPAFDQLALQYSIQFERSAPGWEGRDGAPSAPKAGGYLALTGKLTADSASQIDGLRKAIARKVAHAKLDLSAIAAFDDAGARLLATALGEARRSKLALTLDRPQKLKAALDAAVKNGPDAGEGAWLLALELLQWSHDQSTFDDRAIEYAIAFEMSPPSWEPPPLALDATEPSAEPSAPEAAPDGEVVTLSGVLVGHSPAHVGRLQEFAHGRQVVVVDLTAVERIDFVCAGSFLNAVTRIESQRKAVQVLGASPIIRALLLLIGLSPRHFVKKAV
jgi:anti-anti-sigma regulatory factor